MGYNSLERRRGSGALQLQRGGPVLGRSRSRDPATSRLLRLVQRHVRARARRPPHAPPGVEVNGVSRRERRLRGPHAATDGLDGLEVALGGDEDDGDAWVALEELRRDDRLGLDERVERVAGEAQQNHLEGND